MNEFTAKMNQLGSAGNPFLFVVDFEMEKPLLFPLDEIDPADILYAVEGQTNANNETVTTTREIQFEAFAPEFDVYQKIFDPVMWHLQRGDSYLLNLTQAIPVATNLSLKEIFHRSNAGYKLWIKDHCVVFSPEPFIKINDGIISTHPMKGTIDAGPPNAEMLLTDNPKELAEHYTIVDLLRNDLNMIAEKVRVERFRYVEKIRTTKGELLQTSSQINGQLPNNFTQNLGDILIKLLPAGSVSGAPKKKTVEIIQRTEGYKRGYYTGVFGVFDGKNLNSAVMIRYIEKNADGFVFKAGGGITVNSRVEDEYQEMIQKVYLPFKQ